MIIPQENISTFISKNDGQNSLYKLHVPTNVFFEMVKKEITYEFVGFRVARFDSATNTVVDEKKFNGTRDTSFFKAVDYFEELIEKKLRVTDFKHVIEPFDAGEISFHSGWVFHRAGANATDEMRKVMTIIYMDKDMILKNPENKNQINDWNTWCPGATIGEVIDTPLNPVLY